MSASEKRQLERVVSVRLSAAEHEALTRRAQDAGLSPGAYIRAVVFATPAPPPRRQRTPVKDGRALALLLAQVGKIGGNVNQLAYTANNNLWPQADLWAEARQDIRALRELLMVALGAQRPTPPAQDNAPLPHAYDHKR